MPQQVNYLMSSPHPKLEDAMDEVKRNLEALIASGKTVQSQSLAVCQDNARQYVAAMIVIYL